MPNKSILLLLFSLVATLTFAQIAKRNLIIEGGASLQFINSKADGIGASSSASETVFIATPKVTYFISDRFAAGGGLILGSIVGTGGSFGINGNARFYLSSNSLSAWLVKAEVDYLNGDGFNQFSAAAGLGWDIFLSPNVALESSITIGFTDSNEFITSSNTQFLLGTGLKFFFDRLPEALPEDGNLIIRKGNGFMGVTSGSILLNRRNNTTITSINLAPQFGKFVSDRLLFGSLVNLTNLSAGGFNRFSLEATPFLRYYLNPAGRKFVPFGELGGGISFTYVNGDIIPNGNDTQTNPVALAGVGVDYFIRSNVAVEIKANYRYTKIADFLKQNNIGVSIGFNFFMDKYIE